MAVTKIYSICVAMKSGGKINHSIAVSHVHENHGVVDTSGILVEDEPGGRGFCNLALFELDRFKRILGTSVYYIPTPGCSVVATRQVTVHGNSAQNRFSRKRVSGERQAIVGWTMINAK